MTRLDPRFSGLWTPEPFQADGTAYPTMGYAAAAWINARTNLVQDPWQIEILRRGMLYDPDTLDWVVRDILIVGPEGLGKALAVDTPIATPDGWSTMVQLEPGDQVFGSDGRAVTVSACSNVMLGRTCYEVVFSDGAAIVADSDHQWAVTLLGHPHENTRAVVTTSDLARTQQHQDRGPRYAVDDRRYIVGVNRVDSVPVRCIAVDTPDRLYLAGRQMVPTHNSAWFGGLGLWMLDGPCLPPVEDPRPHPMPDIPVVSAASSLTRHIHRFARMYVNGSQALARRVTVENTKIFRAENEDHRLWFPTGSGAYQQGGGPTTIIEEEIHVGNAVGVKADGIETIKVISSKRSKKAYPGAPRVQRWTITNPDDGDEESLLGLRWKRVRQVLSGEIIDPTILAVHFRADLPWDLDDPEDLRRGIRQSTPSTFVDLEEIAAKYEIDGQSPGWFMRYSGGIFHAADEQVLGDGVLEALTDPPPAGRRPPKGTLRVALAVDGARNRDSVAFYGFTEAGYGWIHDAWERDWTRHPEGTRFRYDKVAIDAAVVEAMDVLYPDAMLGLDPTWLEDMVYDGWGDEDGNWHPGWTERWPDRVVVDVQQEGSEAWTGFRRDATEGTIRLDGDPRTVRHMRNAREKTNRDGKFPKLQKKRDDGKHPIDLLVTATYANRLRKHLPDPPEPPTIH